MNKEKKHKNKKFPGFYIALCCCVLAIGAAGYLSERHESERASSNAKNIEDTTPYPVSMPTMPIISTPITADTSSTISTPIPPSENSDTEPPISKEETEETSAEDYTYDNPDLVQAVSKSDENALPTFSSPLSGQVLQPYSEELIYNQVLSDWRTHDGTDIAANEGASVCCAADGEITSIKDTVYGCEITVSHSGGYETVYSQITATDGLAEGRAVKSGDVIGTVTSPSGENVNDPHLHFELMLDGAHIDPASVISFN